MNFDKNQTQFNSPIHSAIWNAERLIFPLNKSLEHIKDEKTKADCTDYYNCVMDGYADMYANPDVYGLHQDEAEDLLQGKNWGKAMVVADIDDDKAALKPFIKMGKRIEFIRRVCGMIKRDCHVFAYSANISNESYNKNVKFFKNHCDYKEDKFLELMGRLHFEFIPVGSGYELTNYKYPGMFEAAVKMHEACIKRDQKISYHKNPYRQAEDLLDFRLLGDNYECTLEDALYSIDDANKQEVQRLSETLLSLGFQEKCRLNGVDWTYRNKEAITFNGTKPHLNIDKEGNRKHLIRVHFERWNNYGDGGMHLQNKRIMEEVFDTLPNADELKRFCIINLIRCRECGCKSWGPPPHGQCKILFGKLFRTCGGRTLIGIEHLNKDNFDVIIDLAKARIETIDFNKRAPHEIRHL